MAQLGCLKVRRDTGEVVEILTKTRADNVCMCDSEKTLKEVLDDINESLKYSGKGQSVSIEEVDGVKTLVIIEPDGTSKSTPLAGQTVSVEEVDGVPTLIITDADGTQTSAPVGGTGGDADVFVINCESVSGKISGDKTFEEITTAYTEDKRCLLMYEGYVYNLFEVKNTVLYFSRYSTELQMPPTYFVYHRIAVRNTDTWEYAKRTLYYKDVDIDFSDISVNPVANNIITEKFKEVETGISTNTNRVVTLSTKFDSLFDSSGGSSVLTVVKDESKFFDDFGMPMYKCSDSAPTYAEMCNGITITLTSDSGSLTIEMSNEDIVYEGELGGEYFCIALFGGEIPLLLSVPHSLSEETDDGVYTIESGLYVLIDYSAVTGEGNYVVSAVEINGYSFGSTKIKAEYLPDNLGGVTRFYASLTHLYKDADRTQLVTKSELKSAYDSGSIEIVLSMTNATSISTPITCVLFDENSSAASYVTLGQYDDTAAKLLCNNYHTDSKW